MEVAEALFNLGGNLLEAPSGTVVVNGKLAGVAALTEELLLLAPDAMVVVAAVVPGGAAPLGRSWWRDATGAALLVRRWRCGDAGAKLVEGRKLVLQRW